MLFGHNAAIGTDWNLVFWFNSCYFRMKFTPDRTRVSTKRWEELETLSVSSLHMMLSVSSLHMTLSVSSLHMTLSVSSLHIMSKTLSVFLFCPNWDSCPTRLVRPNECQRRCLPDPMSLKTLGVSPWFPKWRFLYVSLSFQDVKDAVCMSVWYSKTLVVRP